MPRKTDMMLCIGPADLVRSTATEVYELLSVALRHLEKNRTKGELCAAANLRVAIDRFELIYKALRGEAGPPTNREPAPDLSPSEALNEVARLLQLPTEDGGPTERLH
jgi:hypothetical protein